MPSSMPGLLRSAVLCCLTLSFAASFPQASNAEETFHAFLSDGDHTLSYASCGGEEAGECVSYELHCTDSGLSLMVLGDGEERDTRAIAKSMLSAPWGEAKLRFRIAGSAEVTVPVGSFSVDLDEMNADWDVTLRSSDESGLFAALSKKTARTAAVEINGKFLPLAPHAGDEAKLLAFKKACAR